MHGACDHFGRRELAPPLHARRHGAPAELGNGRLGRRLRRRPTALPHLHLSRALQLHPPHHGAAAGGRAATSLLRPPVSRVGALPALSAEGKGRGVGFRCRFSGGGLGPHRGRAHVNLEISAYRTHTYMLNVKKPQKRTGPLSVRPKLTNTPQRGGDCLSEI